MGLQGYTLLEEGMTYGYSAYTHDKKMVKGTIDAASDILAEEALYRAGYKLVIGLAEARPKASLERLIPTLYGIKAQDIIDFTYQLATLIESGVPLLTSLQLLEGQAPKAALRDVLANLASELHGGNSLSQALGRYPQVFSYTYCQLIKASEQTGNLDAGLRQIAGYMEKQIAIKKRTSRALAYPALTLAMAAGVFVLLITVALPPLVELFYSLGAELPWTTRTVIAIADFLINNKFTLLGGTSTLILLIAVYSRLPAGKAAFDKFLLRMPLIGTINVQRHMGHFCRTTSMLLKAGIRLPQIMEIVSQTISNRIIRDALSNVRDKLVLGQGLSQPMSVINLFPRMMVEMVVVGENTGTLDSTLSAVADFYEKTVEQRIQSLIALIEPLLTIVVGLLVLFIALSMVTPLYSILGSFR